jgi:hypothetical protein
MFHQMCWPRRLRQERKSIGENVLSARRWQRIVTSPRTGHKRAVGLKNPAQQAGNYSMIEGPGWRLVSFRSIA